MPVEEQACILFSGVKGFLDKIATSEIEKFETTFRAHLKSKHQNILTEIKSTGKISDKLDQEMRAMISEFIAQGGFKMKA
jgi:F0F1-type ATP synthase alpha subunit